MVPKGPRRVELHTLQSIDCKQAEKLFLSVVVELSFTSVNFYIFLGKNVSK